MHSCEARGCSSMAINVDPLQKVCDVCFYKIPLGELLATIHQDGGHYQQEHGVKKAMKDAINKWYSMSMLAD